MEKTMIISWVRAGNVIMLFSSLLKNLSFPAAIRIAAPNFFDGEKKK